MVREDQKALNSGFIVMELENVLNRENSQWLWKVEIILVVSLRASPCFLSLVLAE